MSDAMKSHDAVSARPACDDGGDTAAEGAQGEGDWCHEGPA